MKKSAGAPVPEPVEGPGGRKALRQAQGPGDRRVEGENENMENGKN